MTKVSQALAQELPIMGVMEFTMKMDVSFIIISINLVCLIYAQE